MLLLSVARFFLDFPAALAQNASSLPSCAAGCFSHATSSTTSCSPDDQRCFCSSNDYINTLACCLATTCSSADQQTAVQYNVETCNAVNVSVSEVVGCSPESLSSTISFNTATSTTIESSNMNASMVMSGNPLVTTVSGNVTTLPSIPSTAPTLTATWGTNSLLTGSCTVPFFAVVTDSSGMTTEFPVIGCVPGREDCCPFDSEDSGILTRCPQDYFTTAGACCPSGWQIYFTDLGGETPCYTMPSITHIPASSPTASGITVITEHVFAQKFNLTAGDSHNGLSAGAKAGIGVGVALGLTGLLVGAALVYLRRKKQRQQLADPVPSTEMRTKSDGNVQSPVSAYELPSPGPHDPPGRNSHLLPLSSHLLPEYRPGDIPKQPPQELPGSYFIHQHHPVYTEPQNQSETTASRKFEETETNRGGNRTPSSAVNSS